MELVQHISVVYQFHLGSDLAQLDSEGTFWSLRIVLQHSDMTKVMSKCQHASALPFSVIGVS